MMNPQFSGRPYYLEPLTGQRTFSVRPDGALTGIYYQAAITPGENAARCLDGMNPWKGAHDFDNPPPGTAGHVVAGAACRCGFYAYFDPKSHNPYHIDPESPWSRSVPIAVQCTTLALIQGYGVVTVGTLGFRCGKLRLLCLIAPPEPQSSDERVQEYARILAERFALARARYDVPVAPTLDDAVAMWPTKHHKAAS